MRPVLLAVVCLCACTLPSSRAQWAEQVLAARAATAAAAAAEPAFMPRQLGVRLPSCPATGVLRTPRGIPSSAWPRRMTAQQQAASAATPLLLQLTYAAWLDDPAAKLGACLSAMGVDAMQVINARVQPVGGVMTALVLRAGRTVFVVFRGTDIGDPGDVLVDSNCRHTDDMRRFFGARNSVRLHSGFWSGWQALEQDVRAALERQLVAGQAEVEAADVEVAAGGGGRRPPPTPVHFLGHSLGGALAAIAALRFDHLWRSSGIRTAAVAGVHLFGCPRIGDAGWQEAYNKRLLTRTLRMSNHADFAVRLPMQMQPCPPASPLAPPGMHAFRHVGRSALLCPNTSSGLVEWHVDASGTSEELDCGRSSGGDVPDLTVTTHWLGSYMDAWRRATSDMADTSGVASVMCDACALQYLDRDQQLNVPARAGGPVACGTSSSCNRLPAWQAATAVGTMVIKSFSPLSSCVTYVCS